MKSVLSTTNYAKIPTSKHVLHMKPTPKPAKPSKPSKPSKTSGKAKAKASAKDISARLKELEQELSKVKKRKSELNSEKYTLMGKLENLKK